MRNDDRGLSRLVNLVPSRGWGDVRRDPPRLSEQIPCEQETEQPQPHYDRQADCHGKGEQPIFVRH